jgi:hypothetical protein
VGEFQATLHTVRGELERSLANLELPRLLSSERPLSFIVHLHCDVVLLPGEVSPLGKLSSAEAADPVPRSDLELDGPAEEDLEVEAPRVVADDDVGVPDPDLREEPGDDRPLVGLLFKRRHLGADLGVQVVRELGMKPGPAALPRGLTMERCVIVLDDSSDAPTIWTSLLQTAQTLTISLL